MNWTKIPNAIVFNKDITTEYHEFSNMHPTVFYGPDRKKYYHVEGFFQSHKFVDVDPAHAERIRVEPSATWAKRLGGKRGLAMTSDAIRRWDDRSERVMSDGLMAKFTQNDDLRDLLLSTGDRVLVERPRFRPDKKWACGSKGEGANLTGQLLMQLRSELREHVRCPS